MPSVLTGTHTVCTKGMCVKWCYCIHRQCRWCKDKQKEKKLVSTRSASLADDNDIWKSIPFLWWQTLLISEESLDAGTARITDADAAADDEVAFVMMQRQVCCEQRESCNHWPVLCCRMTGNLLVIVSNLAGSSPVDGSVRENPLQCTLVYCACTLATAGAQMKMCQGDTLALCLQTHHCLENFSPIGLFGFL